MKWTGMSHEDVLDKYCERIGGDKHMRPVYVYQLSGELQEEIRGILTRLLLYQCGSEEDAEGCFGMSLEDAVQLGMDSKIVDVDCAADPLKGGSYMGKKVPGSIEKDVERLSEIIVQRREMETDSPFLYHVREQAGEKDYYDLVNVLWHHGEDDYGLWQVQLPLYLVRNILNSPQNFTGDVDRVMDGIPMEREASSNTLHFLFSRGGRVVCCSAEMDEKFLEKYCDKGASVRGSRADIRADLVETLGMDESLQEERQER